MSCARLGPWAPTSVKHLVWRGPEMWMVSREPSRSEGSGAHRSAFWSRRRQHRVPHLRNARRLAVVVSFAAAASIPAVWLSRAPSSSLRAATSRLSRFHVLFEVPCQAGSPTEDMGGARRALRRARHPPSPIAGGCLANFCWTPYAIRTLLGPPQRSFERGQRSGLLLAAPPPGNARGP